MVRTASEYSTSLTPLKRKLWLVFALILSPFLSGGATIAATDATILEPRYEIFIDADATEPVLFRLHLPAGDYAEPFYFLGPSGPGARIDGLVTIVALSEDGEPLPMDRSAEGYAVTASHPFFIEYELSIHPSTLKPATWPNNHPYSLRWDEFAYISGDAFLRSPYFQTDAAAVVVHTPGSWTVYDAQTGRLEGAGSFRTDDLSSLALLLGPDLYAHPGPSEDVRVIRIGGLPWSDQQLVSSLSSMMEPLRRRGLVESAVYDFVIARYPGALRLNPLISGRAVSPRTMLHWVGVGSHDWWLRHTAADIVRFAMGKTMHLAPEAAWFQTGGADYVGLLLLHEAGLLDMQGMYQNVRTMFATASRYAGAAWPSLLRAGLADPGAHEAQRVLQFRSPAVTFLFDLELRERSGGAVTLLDWWAQLAEQKLAEVYNDDLLPPFHAFGDMSDFFLERVFSADRLSVDFDSSFERWAATLALR